MPPKSFEQTVPFCEWMLPNGYRRLPLVRVKLIVGEESFDLPLIFDTGAEVTVLRADLYPLLGLADWNVGEPVTANTAGNMEGVQAYDYDATLEVFGKTITAKISLMQLVDDPLYQGLLGRNHMTAFGFGFWESTGELFVAINP